MKRGEVWRARFDPAQGSEVNKTRPCVIVSNNAANRTVEKLGRKSTYPFVDNGFEERLIRRSTENLYRFLWQHAV